MTGRELPDRFEEFARSKPVISCRRCGDEVRRRFVDEGICVGCRHRPMTDGGTDLTGTDQSAFSFEEGDTVLVRVREHGTCGNIVVKFTAECQKIETFPTGRTQATFDLPGMMNSVSYAPYEAEFEVVA